MIAWRLHARRRVQHIDYVLAALAAFVAGIVNALAGGGTLISFPALMGLGATNVGANITNTVALCPGYLGGAYAQRGSLDDDRTAAAPAVLWRPASEV